MGGSPKRPCVSHEMVVFPSLGLAYVLNTGNERFITKPRENQSMTEIQIISTERIEKNIKK